MKTIKIEWEDSKGVTTNWEFVDEMEKLLPNQITSIGYLLEKTDKYVTICQSINNNPPDNQQVIGRMTIPTCSITTMQEIG